MFFYAINKKINGSTGNRLRSGRRKKLNETQKRELIKQSLTQALTADVTSTSATLVAPHTI